MKKLFLVTLVTMFTFVTNSQAAVSKHALGKVAKAAVAAPVHPKRTVKQVIGSVVFAGEAVIDVAHVSFVALDALTGSDLDADAQRIFFPVHAVFHAGDVVFAKADSGLEAAESFFFGTSN